jgi:hypothetical protein
LSALDRVTLSCSSGEGKPPGPALEKVAVRAGTDEIQEKLVRLHFVDEEPVRLDVAFAAPGILADECMIAIAGRKLLTGGKLLDDGAQQSISRPRF